MRFNPNLYSNGKVCLSLLGTWRGSSTEMWDPKLSTILQLLISIQAIIMSNEVYFNEPGYEHEMNTEKGERKNTGYANIVKYCNIKFAMIETIKNPPKGFEQVVRKSFYLKKKEILAEVAQWVEDAKKEEASYAGLVTDHNYTWATKFIKQGAYEEAIKAARDELEEVLNSIPNPFASDQDESADKDKGKLNDENLKVLNMLNPKQQKVELETIDVSYGDADQKQEVIDV